MPVRIYALAKELNIDSKELVDLCTKAGVTGKGSALASLTDEELRTVNEFLAKLKSRGRTPAPAAPVAASNAPAPSRPVPEAPVRAITRDEYVPPTGASGKMRDLDSTESRPESKRETDRPKAPIRREPVVKLAAIPESTAPAVAQTSQEPAAQRPIMSLPKEAIRGARQGSSAPLQQFTRQQDKKRREEPVPPVTTSPAARSSGPTAPPRDPREMLPPPDEIGDGSQKPRSAKRKKEKEKDPDAKKEAPEGDVELAGMANPRALREQNRRRRKEAISTEDEADDMSSASRRRQRQAHHPTAAPVRRDRVTIQLPCTVRVFSETTGISAVKILRSLMSMGVNVANINADLPADVAELLATEAGLTIEFRHPISLEEQLLQAMDEQPDDPADLVARPPIVTFLGHVDHGKTSLLDRIIGINVVSGEAGGITQHIRAYSVEKNGKRISFVDTPGHEAFTEMRARGATVTDIAVLVVAGDDGVMPQTEEALSHARAANVPIVVALNKMDLPGVDANRVLQDLAAHELLPTEWGGEVEVIRTSALTGAGIDDLLETLLLTAELHEWKANPTRPAIGTCLEAQQEGGRGVVAKLIVQNGTLRVGDIVVCGSAHGRVKALYDTLDSRKRLTEAGPSMPVNVTGIDIAPEAGERFFVLHDIAQAREIAAHRAQRSRTQSLSGRSTRVSFEEFQRRLGEGRLGVDEDVAVLSLIIRADVRGSIEAIRKELAKFDHPEVKLQILQASVGGITVADVTLADASNAVIVGFNVIPDEAARAMADQRGVEIRRYDIIYKLTEDIKKMVEGKLRPEEQVNELGRALVQQVFNISRVGAVAGCRVLAGTIERNCRIRVNRDGRGIGDYALDSLKREKDDAREVREGFECGMKLSGFNDIKEGDILEAYKVLEVARTL